MMFATKFIVYCTLFVGFAQKETSVYLLRPNGSTSGYVTFENGCISSTQM